MSADRAARDRDEAVITLYPPPRLRKAFFAVTVGLGITCVALGATGHDLAAWILLATTLPFAIELRTEGERRGLSSRWQPHLAPLAWTVGVAVVVVAVPVALTLLVGGSGWE